MLVDKYKKIAEGFVSKGAKEELLHHMKVAGTVYTAAQQIQDDMGFALRAFNQETTHAGILVAALQLIFGKEATEWDLDAVWYELYRDHKVDVPLVNRDKLAAALALTEARSFYWDAGVFENTIQAFNDIDVNVDIVQEPDPEHLCWGVAEANLIVENDCAPPEVFNHEPQSYAAVVLHREHFILAPEPLCFCQEALDGLKGKNYVGPATCEVKEFWEEIKSTPDALEEVLKASYPENALGVQIRKLASCLEYVTQRAKSYATQLAKLEVRDADI